MMPTKINTRETTYHIDPVYVNRWSTRSFSDKQVEEEKLFAILEAATWAPSAANWQPWHFIVAQTNEERAVILDFLNGGNALWCQYVPTFIVLTSRKVHEQTGKTNASHVFDAGTAWGFLALEANRQGLMTHAMTGLDKEKARALLAIPDEYELQAVIAVGYHDPTNKNLSETLIDREVPSTRKPVNEFISRGKF